MPFANLALRKLGFDCGRYDIIHPLDDVNRGQSTNDVYPTALRIAAIQMLRKLSESCAKLQQPLLSGRNSAPSLRIDYWFYRKSINSDVEFKDICIQSYIGTSSGCEAVYMLELHE